ncbi:MAG: hypothetical protein ACXVBQ_17155 [Pseudobdellovibrionaceae bacterium]
MKSRYSFFFSSLILLASAQVQAADVCTPKVDVFFDPAAGQYVDVYGELAKQIFNNLSYSEQVSGGVAVKTDSFSVKGPQIQCLHFIDDDRYTCVFHSTNY